MNFLCKGTIFFPYKQKKRDKLQKSLHMSKKSSIFAPAFVKQAYPQGLLWLKSGAFANAKESCLSGRKSRTRNAVYALRRIGGSNPSLSANAVNQWFTAFIL